MSLMYIFEPSICRNSSSLLACYSKACLVFDIHLRHHLLRETWMLWAKKFDKRPSSNICVGLVCIVHVD